MKLQLNSLDISRFQHLLDVKDMNIQVADMYLYYLQEEPLYITQKFQQLTSPITDETTTFYQTLMHCLGVDLNDEKNQLLATQYFQRGIKKLDSVIYKHNPYYQLIHPVAQKLGSWSIKYRTYQPYQGFAYDDISVDPTDFQELTALGFFNEPYPYLAIYEGSKLWMSLIPHEMMTMQAPLNHMNGNIVVFGLGLGYFTLMAAMKNDVNHITVIENNPDVIRLFKSVLLPLFPHQEKITIIEADANDYLMRMPLHFNAAFVDIWLGVNDGLWHYLTFKSVESNYETTHFAYWLERSLLAYFRRLVLIYLEEVLLGTNDSHYQIANSEEDKIINALHHHFQSSTFTTYDQIHDLLGDESLKTLARTMKR